MFFLVSHGDDESKPNKFNVGDFVTVSKENEFREVEQQVGVVYKTPERNNPKIYFQNIYCISLISKEGKYQNDLYSENELKKYEGEIGSNSPLLLLKKYYKGEIEIRDELFKKIIDNKIVLNKQPSWRDIEELQELMGEQLPW